MPKVNKKGTSDWVLPTSAFGKRWTGFYMSTDQNSSKHRRLAKCQHCQETMDGKQEGDTNMIDVSPTEEEDWNEEDLFS
jgi:hypothetical protein